MAQKLVYTDFTFDSSIFKNVPGNPKVGDRFEVHLYQGNNKPPATRHMVITVRRSTLSGYRYDATEVEQS